MDILRHKYIITKKNLFYTWIEHESGGCGFHRITSNWYKPIEWFIDKTAYYIYRITGIKWGKIGKILWYMNKHNQVLWLNKLFPNLCKL